MERPFNCNYCTKNFRWRNHLERHMNKQHKELSIFEDAISIIKNHKKIIKLENKSNIIIKLKFKFNHEKQKIVYETVSNQCTESIQGIKPYTESRQSSIESEESCTESRLSSIESEESRTESIQSSNKSEETCTESRQSSIKSEETYTENVTNPYLMTSSKDNFLKQNFELSIQNLFSDPYNLFFGIENYIFNSPTKTYTTPKLTLPSNCKNYTEWLMNSDEPQYFEPIIENEKDCCKNIKNDLDYIMHVQSNH